MYLIEGIIFSKEVNLPFLILPSINKVLMTNEIWFHGFVKSEHDT